MVSPALMVEKIFTKNCSAVHYFLTDFNNEQSLMAEMNMAAVIPHCDCVT